MSNQQLMAELAAEYWKLLRAFERAATLAPDAARDRLTAQARYSAGWLDSLIEKAGLRLALFDGMTFEINLPAVAVNAEDVAVFQALVVERTIEPIAPASDKEG